MAVNDYAVFTKAKVKSLQEGIPHKLGCRYNEMSIPINESQCDCNDFYWFEQGVKHAKGEEL